MLGIARVSGDFPYSGEMSAGDFARRILRIAFGDVCCHPELARLVDIIHGVGADVYVRWDCLCGDSGSRDGAHIGCFGADWNFETGHSVVCFGFVDWFEFLSLFQFSFTFEESVVRL